MPDDILGLELNGKVTLHDFARAIQRLHSLVAKLEAEVAPGAQISWIVDDLHPGSAFASWKGQAKKPDQQFNVSRVVRAYGDVGNALQEGREPFHSEEVVKSATLLIALIDKNIDFMRFETSEDDAIVRRTETAGPGKLGRVHAAPAPHGLDTAYGAVEGRIQTLSNRGHLRFTLYDALHDRAVSCYLAEGHEDIMRDVWGKRAIVEGIVRRDAETGRALTVRQITRVTVIPELDVESYKRARGIAPVPPGGIDADEAIRRVRDA